MGRNIVKVLDIDGEYRENPDHPVAVVREAQEENRTGHAMIIDPVLDSNVVRNLYGRIMTLVEATTDAHKLKPVKDLFGKEINSWVAEVHGSAGELAGGANSGANLYTRQNVPSHIG